MLPFYFNKCTYVKTKYNLNESINLVRLHAENSFYRQLIKVKSATVLPIKRPFPLSSRVPFL